MTLFAGRQRREGPLTICMAIPAATPPAIPKAAGKLSRPAPSAAFTTMKTAPSTEVEAGRGSSAPGLCSSRARSLLSARHSRSPSSLLMPTWLRAIFSRRLVPGAEPRTPRAARRLQARRRVPQATFLGREAGRRAQPPRPAPGAFQPSLAAPRPALKPAAVNGAATQGRRKRRTTRGAALRPLPRGGSGRRRPGRALGPEAPTASGPSGGPREAPAPRARRRAGGPGFPATFTRPTFPDRDGPGRSACVGGQAPARQTRPRQPRVSPRRSLALKRAAGEAAKTPGAGRSPGPARALTLRGGASRPRPPARAGGWETEAPPPAVSPARPPRKPDSLGVGWMISAPLSLPFASETKPRFGRRPRRAQARANPGN